MLPFGKLFFYHRDDAIESWEVLVMDTKSTRQFPNPLNGIQVRAVGRKVVETKSRGLLVSPPLVHFRVMVSGIVADGQDALAFLKTALVEELHKVPEALSIKSIRFAGVDEHAIAQAYRSQISHALPRRVVPDDGIAVFRRYPQAAP